MKILKKKEGSSMTEPPAEPENGSGQLISIVLNQRGSNTRMRSMVSRGMVSETETYAIPYVSSYCPSSHAQTAVLRAAGLAAYFKDIKSSEIPLGTSLRLLSARLAGKANFKPNPDEPDIVGRRIATLHEQDLEEAVATIRRLMDLSAGTGISFNFHSIARILERWGNGYSDSSRKVRIRILSEYWGGWDEKKRTDIKTSTEAN